jgi:transposase
MDDPDARPPRRPVDRLTAIQEWLWRHSSQPNGDPWDGDPEHLDRAAQNLLSDLAQALNSTTPQPATATHAPRAPHPLVDAHGPPLNMPVPPANRHDSPLIEPIQNSMPAIKRGGRGHPRRRPVKFHGDKDYGNPRVRRYLGRRGITARIARHGDHPGHQLGRHRWVVERILGWLRSYKRLALRYKRLALRHDRTAATITALDRLVITFICAHQPPANSCNDLQYCNGNSSCRRF